MLQFPSCINIWGGREQEGQSGFLSVDTHLASILSLGNESSGSKSTRKTRQELKPPILTHINIYNYWPLVGESQHLLWPFGILGKDQCNQEKAARANNAWLLPLLWNDIKIHIRHRMCVCAQYLWTKNQVLISNLFRNKNSGYRQHTSMWL